MRRYEDVYGQEFPPLGLISVWFGVILILITAAARILVTASAQISTTPFVTSLQLPLIALILGSFLYLIIHASFDVKKAAIPLVINLGTFLIVHFVPFDGLWQEARFQWRWNSYNAVVALVSSGEIQPDEHGIARLPHKYRFLSNDQGQILVEIQDEVIHIFFFTSRRTPQSFSGFLYRSDNNPPYTGEFGGRWRHVVEKRPHWFFCTSY